MGSEISKFHFEEQAPVVVLDQETKSKVDRQLTVLNLERAFLGFDFKNYFSHYGLKPFYKKTNRLYYDHFVKKGFYKVTIGDELLKNYDTRLFKHCHFPVSSTLEVRFDRDKPMKTLDILEGARKSQVESLETVFSNKTILPDFKKMSNDFQKTGLKNISIHNLVLQNKEFWKLFLAIRHIEKITFHGCSIMTDKKVDIGHGFDDSNFEVLGIDWCGYTFLTDWAKHPERLENIVSTIGSSQKVRDTLNLFFWNEPKETFPIAEVKKMFKKNRLTNTSMESWIQTFYPHEP